MIRSKTVVRREDMTRMYELLLTSATATDSRVDIPLYPIHLVSCETFLLCTLHSHQRLLPLISIRDIFYGVDLRDIQTCKNLTIPIPKSCFESSKQTKRNVFCIITTIYETLTSVFTSRGV